jgi:hypothetical protein
MGSGICSVHHRRKDELDKSENAEDCDNLHDSKAEISRLRLKIVETIPLSFGRKTIILLVRSSLGLLKVNLL